MSAASPLPPLNGHLEVVAYDGGDVTGGEEGIVSVFDMDPEMIDSIHESTFGTHFSVLMRAKRELWLSAVAVRGPNGCTCPLAQLAVMGVHESAPSLTAARQLAEAADAVPALALKTSAPFHDGFQRFSDPLHVPVGGVVHVVLVRPAADEGSLQELGAEVATAMRLAAELGNDQPLNIDCGKVGLYGSVESAAAATAAVAGSSASQRIQLLRPAPAPGALYALAPAAGGAGRSMLQWLDHHPTLHVVFPPPGAPAPPCAGSAGAPPARAADGCLQAVRDALAEASGALSLGDGRDLSVWGSSLALDGPRDAAYDTMTGTRDAAEMLPPPQQPAGDDDDDHDDDVDSDDEDGHPVDGLAALVTSGMQMKNATVMRQLSLFPAGGAGACALVLTDPINCIEAGPGSNVSVARYRLRDWLAAQAGGAAAGGAGGAGGALAKLTAADVLGFVAAVRSGEAPRFFQTEEMFPKAAGEAVAPPLARSQLVEGSVRLTGRTLAPFVAAAPFDVLFHSTAGTAMDEPLRRSLAMLQPVVAVCSPLAEGAEVAAAWLPAGMPTASTVVGTMNLMANEVDERVIPTGDDTVTVLVRARPPAGEPRVVALGEWLAEHRQAGGSAAAAAGAAGGDDQAAEEDEGAARRLPTLEELLRFVSAAGSAPFEVPPALLEQCRLAEAAATEASEAVQAAEAQLSLLQDSGTASSGEFAGVASALGEAHAAISPAQVVGTAPPESTSVGVARLEAAVARLRRAVAEADLQQAALAVASSAVEGIDSDPEFQQAVMGAMTGTERPTAFYFTGDGDPAWARALPALAAAAMRNPHVRFATVDVATVPSSSRVTDAIPAFALYRPGAEPRFMVGFDENTLSLLVRNL